MTAPTQHDQSLLCRCPNTILTLWCVVAAALCLSSSSRQGLKSAASSRQLALQHPGIVHEERDEDLHAADNSRVFFDIGDNISYVIRS